MAALALAGALVFLLGSTSPNGRVVEAERFVMTDSGGRMRAVLEVFEEQPRLALFDSAETLRFEVVVDDGGPWMRLYEASGRERAYFGLHDEDGPAIDLVDPNGIKRITLASTKGGDGLLVHDGSNVQRASLSFTGKSSHLFLRDEHNTPSLGLISSPGAPFLQMKGPSGRPQVYLGISGDRPLFGIYESDGRTIFSRPRSHRLREPEPEKSTGDHR